MRTFTLKASTLSFLMTPAIKAGFMVVLISFCLMACAHLLEEKEATTVETATVRLDLKDRGADINPFIYGQFIEHLGRCIYGGIERSI